MPQSRIYSRLLQQLKNPLSAKQTLSNKATQSSHLHQHSFLEHLRLSSFYNVSWTSQRHCLRLATSRGPFTAMPPKQPKRGVLPSGSLQTQPSVEDDLALDIRPRRSGRIATSASSHATAATQQRSTMTRLDAQDIARSNRLHKMA